MDSMLLVQDAKPEAQREKIAMKIALLQIAAQDTLKGTLDKGILFCRKAKEMGADESEEIHEPFVREDYRE